MRSGYKKTKIGVIPEDWEVKKLGEITELITKGTTPTTLGFSFCKSGINFIKIENIDKFGNFNSKILNYIDLETNQKLKRSQLKNNDILFSIAGALGRTAIVTNDILPANTNQALSIIRFANNKIVSVNYCYYFLRTNISQFKLV